MNNKCIACGHELKRLMTFENMPASAQNIPDAEELREDFPVTLELCQCPECGLVQFDCEPVDYYRDVIRAGGGTSTMTRLRHEEYARLLGYMREYGIKGRNIVEVGCGRGEFLRMWQNLADDEAGMEALKLDSEKDMLSGQPKAGPIRLTGIEHKKELVDEAMKLAVNEKPVNAVGEAAGVPEIRYQVFEGFAEGDYKIPNGPFDAFVQFNFLEHQPYPQDMLRSIRNNLKDKAIGLVTVPSFEYILKYNGYYELLHDHIANYTEFTLQKLFQDNGFEVLDMRTVNRDTIEIIVRKAESEDLSTLRYNGRLIDVSALRESYDRMAKDINAHIEHLTESGKTLAIWGASHQGFTLAATTGLSGKVKYIIDSAKFKQGRFAPASHIPIVSPDHFGEDPVDEILIVAPGYTDEIAGIIKERYGSDVRVLVLKTDRIQDYK
ncbi:class I SAM-dependent methyltransferase [Oribacterium sp. WCC10]|uniref:class I SAM-dependent methyltransferase n=1 Tax=Oribacterium sp. WCC10 TaxID=1855343 RepID=UPI0008E91026|nr:class I SAM-dependent methyltransferase [Oribacterium sp. WCC10]SFG36430.1 Methyltransferase domain-containing protein [Oribacterium sp. WCC10]